MINHHRAVRSCHNIYRLGFLFTKFRGGGAASYIFFLNRCRQCKKYTFPLWYMIKESHMFNQVNFVCRGEISWRLVIYKKNGADFLSDGQLECTFDGSFQNIRVPTCKYLFDNYGSQEFYLLRDNTANTIYLRQSH